MGWESGDLGGRGGSRSVPVLGCRGGMKGASDEALEVFTGRGGGGELADPPGLGGNFRFTGTGGPPCGAPIQALFCEDGRPST